jgi:esterase/lipase
MKFFILIISLFFVQHAGAAGRAVALVGHGLNNSPESMGQISTLLTAWGIEAVPLALTGHSGAEPDSPMPVVSSKDWQRDFSVAYQIASSKAKQAKLPLFFVGFSLSTVVALAAMQDSQFHFDKIILLAPPLQIKATSRAVGALPAGGMNIPSMMPKPLRAHKGTSTAAYHALFDTIEMAKLIPSLAAIPTLVIIDPKDEMVDAARTVDQIKSQAPRWRVHSLSVEKPGGYGFHHLLIDQKCVGPDTWSKMTAAMNLFLLP